MGDVLKQWKKDKGRGRGRGASVARGGRGRGRGRGRALPPDVVNLADDDDLCNMALAKAELDNNSITKMFEAVNEATQLDGFNEASGDIWIYPTNRPVRDYQFEMVKTALFNNTLVTLPTGLGKTFISAVVMYNFHRWYPNGLIVFMAPTRPLVKQQLTACHTSVGISPSKTVELTGSIQPDKRQALWKSKTVFFLTPQVMLSDLQRNFFSPENIRCVVVDEAHRALGNQAVVQVISKIVEKNSLFRVLALSATPGSDIASVQQVLKNLLISSVELRSDDSPDILPYTHNKDVEKIVVKVEGYLKHVYTEFIQIFQIYSGKLMKAGALTGRDGSSYSKFQLLKSRESFRQGLAQKLANYQKRFIENDFNVCISLAHAQEILLTHGLRTFYSFLQGIFNKEKGNPLVRTELEKNETLRDLLSDIQTKLNISVENSTFDFDFDTSGNASMSRLFSVVGESPSKTFFSKSFKSAVTTEDVDYTLSHPKLQKLKQIVQQHFEDHSSKLGTTRIIIFSQYRDSVQEIGQMLNSLRPVVMPMIFVGKANASGTSKGLKHKDQIHIMKEFREGNYNVLVSTSVGEEGLDIGEVDLIICFDSSKSPTRLIQRMGRTGRQRNGRTVFLITEGKEERSYSASISMHSSISKNISDPRKLEQFLYKCSPRMVPMGFKPECYKMPIIISSEQSSTTTDAVGSGSDVDFNENETDADGIMVLEPKPSAKAVKKKPSGVRGKPKKPTKQTVQPKNTISKLFERMTNSDKGSSSTSSQKETVTRNVSILDVPPRDWNTSDHEVVPLEYDDDIQMLVVQQQEPLVQNYAFQNIFNTNDEERKAWKPCTTFHKIKQPGSVAVISELLKWGYTEEDMIFDKATFHEFERNIKSRDSFYYPKSEYCDCGNFIEPHEKRNCDNVPSLVLVESRTNENVSVEEATVEVRDVRRIEVGNANDNSRLCVQSIEDGNENYDETFDEMPPSPEICKNSIYEKVKEIKALKSQGNAHEAISQSLLSQNQNTKNRAVMQPTSGRKIKPPVTVTLPSFRPPNKENVPKIALSQKRFAISTETPASKSLECSDAADDDDDDDFISPRKIFALPSRSRSSLLYPDKVTTSSKIAVEDPGKESFLVPDYPAKKSRVSPKSTTVKNTFRSPCSETSSHCQGEFRDDSASEAEITTISPNIATVRPGTKKRFDFARFRQSGSVSLRCNKGCDISEEESIREISIANTTEVVESNSIFESPGSFFKSPTSSVSRFRFATSSPNVSARRSVSINPHSPESPIAKDDSFDGSKIDSPVARPLRKARRFRSKHHPFLLTQADEEMDEDEEDFKEDGVGDQNTDLDDSFVTHSESFGVTESQRAMYLQSMKDFPTNFGRVEKPLSPKGYGTSFDGTVEEYDKDDSFCNDEVEYSEVGCFTQAMNLAKLEIAQDDGSSAGSRYKTRQAKRNEIVVEADASRKNGNKKRRRVMTFDDSDDE